MLNEKDRTLAASVASRIPEVLARAVKYPMHVNRGVVVLAPGPRFVEWHTTWTSGVKGQVPVPGDRAYLVPITVTSADELQAFLLRHASLILESVVQGYMPRTRWPWEPTETEFSEWFHVTFVAQVEDLCGTPLVKDLSMGAVVSGL